MWGLSGNNPRTIGAWLESKAEINGARVALEIVGRSKSYSHVYFDSLRLASGMTDLGLKAGDRAALMMKNSLEAVDAWFAMCQAGVVEVPINTAYRGHLLHYMLENSGSSVIFLDEEFLPHLLGIYESLPDLRHIIVYRESEEDRSDFPGSALFHDISDVYSDNPFSRPKLHYSDTSVILYTSGTTGPSKGVILSHESNLNLVRHTRWLMDYEESDILYTMFPLFHINAKYTSLMCAMESDGKLIMDRQFSASRFWEKCRQEGITAFNYQGGMIQMLWKQPERDMDIHNPVKKAFGAPCPVDIWRPFEERFGLALTEVYGMTEAAIATENTPPNRKIGTAGRESANFTVQVVDENDVPVPANTPGEIVVRPKKPDILFGGYLNLPEKTLSSMKDLWFHTGDRGRLDEDGFLTFIDRVKDCVRRRGENISSYEVETVVNTHSAVLESAVYGVPSELGEEEVLVAIVLKADAILTEVELLDFCQDKMAHFAIPRFVRWMTELPKTPSQRVEKFKLRKEGVTHDTWDRERSSYVIRR